MGLFSNAPQTKVWGIFPQTFPTIHCGVLGSDQNKMGRRGFTLVELTIAIVVVAIGFYAIISVFISVAPRNVNAEDLSKASYLANRIIEEKISKPFASISSESSTAFASPFSNFRYLVNVSYATTAEPDTTSGTPTLLKKVDVQCWGGSSGTVEVITLVATYGL